MAELGGFTGLSLAQQADIIRSVCIFVASRREAKQCMHLYSLEHLFVEISYQNYPFRSEVNKIRYINNTKGLQPYLDEINLSL